MSNPLDKVPMVKPVFAMLCNVKAEELLKVSEAYNVPEKEFLGILEEKLTGTGMHAGACNLAVDFLIDEVTLDKTHKDVSTAVCENILAAGVYYANVMGSDPTYPGAKGTVQVLKV